MVQPINYMGMIPQPNLAQSLASGLQLGSGIREMQQQRVAAEQAQAAKQQLAADVQAAREDGSQKAWLGMIAKYPQFREAFGDVRKGLGEEQVKNEFFGGMEISNALEANQPLVAAERLRKEIAGRENSGQDARLYKQALERIEEGDTKRAQSGINEILSVLDPDRFEKTVKAKTTAATAPAVLQKAQAEATQAEQKALNAVATARDDIAKTEAEAKLAIAQADKAKIDAQVAEATKPSVISEAASKADEAKVKADFAKRNQIAALEKQAADLGLTNAQRNQVLASTKKLGYETQQAALALKALEASGGVDPDKKFSQEEKIRKEWQGRSKVYSELSGIYSNLDASAKAKTGPGDIALITGFMKMLDPGSVVRETEFATARDTAGLFAILSNQAQKIQSGQLFALDSKQRDEYVTLAKKYLDSAEKKATQEKKDLDIVVRNYKLNPENVFGATRNVIVEY